MPKKAKPAQTANSLLPAKLSKDALWVWRELWTDGVELLDGPREDLLLAAFIDEHDVPWSPARFDAALRELRAARVLVRRRVADPQVQCGVGQITKAGVLVDVRLVAFADTDREHEYKMDPLDDAADTMGARLRRAERPYPHRSQLAIFWCETDDHDEDWFVTASNRWTAARCFEAHEGYNKGDCTATWAADVPPALVRARGTHAHYANEAELVASGGVFLPMDPDGDATDAELRQRMGVVSKAVRFGSRTYAAGDIVANTAVRLGARAKH